MAYVLAQTGLASALDDRPAAATGALGMLVVGAFSLLMLAAPSAPEPDEGVDELRVRTAANARAFYGLASEEAA